MWSAQAMSVDPPDAGQRWNIIIGEKELSFNALVLALGKNKAAKSSLQAKWKELARILDIDETEVVDLDQEMMYRRKQILDVVQTLFQMWRQRNADTATLGKLIELVQKIELNDVAAVLLTLPEKIDLC